ncbi:MAG: outer membrane protein assembly factor BamA [Candidatus Krumholzibacteria bacterium]|nr:outer membrane protein assembly factor BamA [Candidatus Krumholzibacteria bacterium]
MRTLFLQMLGCILVLHLLSVDANAQSEIFEIKIEGNRFVSEQKILRILRLKPGDPYRDQSVSEALKRLYSTKEFSDVQAFKEEMGSGVVLTILVVEHTRIEEVRFEGNRHIKTDELAEATAVKEGSFVRPALLRKDRETIEKMYREKGYYRVSVKDDIVTERQKKASKTTTVLVYKVEEGEKVSVKHIDFFGNRSLDSDDLRKAMESKEDGWLRSAEFKPKVLEEDRGRIAELYRSHGFLDAEISDQELIFSDDGKDLDIFVTIKEGTQFKVGKVSWTGNEVFNDDRVAALITFETGDVFDDSEFSQIQLALNEIYWNQGYIYNSISPGKKVTGDVIDVNFDISEGKPAHIHEINIAGNTKTSEEVIRRELTVNPGDVFRTTNLRRSLREVFNLGFFNGPADVGTTPRDNGDIDITLTVEEKQTGQFRLGAGFSQLNRISGFIGLAETNFLGKGLQVGVDWEFSSFRQTVDLRFTEPWLFGTPTQLSVNVFNRVQDQVRQQFYDDRRLGASLRIGRPFPWFDYTSVFWRYSWESIELSDFSRVYIDSDGPLLNIDWPQVTSSTALTLVRNSTDSPFRPTTGTRASITAEFNGGVLGGDVQFQSYDLGFSLYERLFKNVVLQLKYQAGISDGFGSTGDVPDYELFRLGGNRRYSVRGYDFFDIVPEGNPPFLGGRFMNILSYEVTVPIAPTIYALGFLDAGNTWNSFQGADIFDLKKGLGLGIRIELPMLGIMGFDYGYGFDKPGGAAWEPHLNLGGAF